MSERSAAVPPGIAVGPVRSDERIAWQALFQAYCAFYLVDATLVQVDRVWNWIHDPASSTGCLLARLPDGAPVGLVHYRTWDWPLRGETACFLDDLYVIPERRHRGVGRSLLTELADVAHAKGWTVVRWITRCDNDMARRLYDRVATVVPVVTYEMPAGTK
jgi:ribosomal protein S18 acetylase RimI-like enzyme